MFRAGERSERYERRARSARSEFKAAAVIPPGGVRVEAPEKCEVFGYPGHFWASSRASQGTWKD